MDGICTLANDYVYDQLVALLNSIEAVYGSTMPVCIYPYDDRLDRLRALIGDRPHVQIYADAASMQRWDEFAQAAWDTHPTARQIWQQAGSAGYHRFGTHRRYAAFDGPFDRFVYMDADTLLLQPLTAIWAALETVDWVVYDYQRRDLSHVYTVDAPLLPTLFSPARLETEIFCSGFYGAKRGLFPAPVRSQLLSYLQAGEAAVLYPMAPDQTLLNYMVMRSGLPAVNLALTLPTEERTGNSVTSSHFEVRGDRVYDRGQPLTYLHYIGVSSRHFANVCAGQNLLFPYRDVFLEYRYRHEPDRCPQFTGPGVRPTPPPTPTVWERGWHKLRAIAGQAGRSRSAGS